ncbi:MAG: hypothetical protein H6P94_579 [Thermoplasmatales archaeon]|nr:hypothetical protein [Thermoplasmatales archaeon]
MNDDDIVETQGWDDKFYETIGDGEWYILFLRKIRGDDRDAAHRGEKQFHLDLDVGFWPDDVKESAAIVVDEVEYMSFFPGLIIGIPDDFTIRIFYFEVLFDR